MSHSILIRPLAAAEATTCETILRSLPNWFGIEDAIVQYGHDIKSMDTYIAEADGRIVGFLTLNQHNPYTAEIHIIAVREDYHRCGIGRNLVKHVEQSLRSRSVEYLTVKTLGPSKPSIHYDRTRDFYMAVGFRPMEETNLWGEENPCLIMVKRLPCEHSAS
jgi:N-acetylglutamate synthase-like GNAT family acetyltransferase